MSQCEVIIFAVLTILVGLLFIDLVPLQENMTCGQYGGTDCPDTFFSTSYQDARERFLSAATLANAEIEHHLVLRSGNVDYYIDTAFFRGKKPEKLMVHASGTHGVEGYTGSAIQTKLLREWNESFVEGPSILFVHAINPYGMAHNRRFNENNVDLNRNYLSDEQWHTVKARDSNAGGYETFRDLLASGRAPRFIDRYWFFYSAATAIARNGFAALKRAIVSGQYHHKEGIYFGGDEEQRSVTLLRELLRKHAVGLTDAIFLDVHTGLGPTGVDTIMCSNAKDAERSRAIFTSTRVQDDSSAKDGPSAGYDLALGIIRPSAELGPNALAVTEEFGTVNPLFVVRAMILENQAYQHCNRSYVHEVMGHWIRDAFYPQDLKYKNATLQRGTSTFWNAVKHLTA